MLKGSVSKIVCAGTAVFLLVIPVFVMAEETKKPFQVASTSQLSEPIPLSLKEAVALALRDNRDILFKGEEVKKAKAKVREVKAGLFPSLNFTGGWTKTNGLYSKDYSQSSVQLSAKQYLYRGGKTASSIKQNEYNKEAQEAAMRAAQLEIVAQVKKAFYTLMLTDEFKRLNSLIFENALSHQSVLQARYKSGLASESDLIKAQGAVSKAQEAYESSVNQCAASQALINNLLFLDESVVVKPVEALTYMPVDIAYSSAFLDAMKLRPEIKQYEYQLKSDRYAIEAVKAESRPSIYASFDSFGRTHLLASTTKNQNDYNTIGITLSWPIFDGFLTKSKVEQALIDLRQTQLLRDIAVKDIALELKNAYVDLKNAIAKIEAQKQDMLIYQDNLAVATQQYSQGIASTLDVNDARLKSDIAEFNHKESIYEYLMAKAGFDKATGGL